MNIIVNGAVSSFIEGKLVFQYFDVSVSMGSTPRNIGGYIQLTTEEGVSISSTEQEVIEATKAYVNKLIQESPEDPTIK